MLQQCLGCGVQGEFYEDDCTGISEEDGGPVCFVCLTRAESDPELLSKLEAAGVDLD